MLIKVFLLIAVLAAVTMSAPLLVDPINFEKEWSEWKIVSHHDHAVHVAEAYSFLRMNDGVKTAFIEYFNQGLTPAGAKIYHETCLLATIPENDDALKVLADGHENTTERSIYHLYNVWKSENVGDRTSTSMIDVIKSKQAHYLENDVYVTVKEDPFIVCILTPLMKRTHHETFSNEIVFIDTTGSCDQTGSNITFMFGASKIGAIPLGCDIHTSQNEEWYYSAFMALKDAIEQCGFFNKSPSAIMTDDSSAERNALNKDFPASKLLLCSFHVCQAMWRWLWDTNHGIENMHQKFIMLMFRQIVFERDLTACEELMKEFLSHPLVLEYPLLQDHLTQFWERKSEWCICYRSSYLTRGHNTNNMVEVSIRIFKENVLQRSKSFKTVATIDFISNQLEQHYIRRSRTYALSRKTNLDLLHKQFCMKAENLQVKKLDNCTFHVTSSDNAFVPGGQISEVKFNKTYESPEEEARRLEIFKDNALKIAEHNTKYVAGKVTWTQGLNQFADLTQEEFSKTYLGTRKLVSNAATAV